MTISKVTHPLDWIDDELAALDAAVLRRRLTAHAGPQGPLTTIGGRACVNFGSNDYLGLAADPRVLAAACAAIEREGWGSAASPLLAGRGESHRRLEAQLAQFEGTEAALVFSSGFAANVGVLTALASRG
ncbi:MAG TPA: aminotransferase class I/II-fold pyridoxal phosphate-dependent enzyme, partial [Pirellulales bacterium]